MIRVLLIFSLTMSTLACLKAQHALQPSDSFNIKRFTTISTVGAGIYVGMSVGLYQAWYKKQDLGKFHFFNDNGEWLNMDKFGHWYTAYMQGVICYKGAKWAGLSERKSILVGILTGTLFQTTLETMDGFSNKWGFSTGDMIANISGTTTFALQQYYWGEQRIKLKYASYPPTHPNLSLLSTDGKSSSTLLVRTEALFGDGFFERALKDYNGQTYWMSFNVRSFFPNTSWPKWLNVAIGTGAGNMYGGFENRWIIGDATYQLGDSYDRYRKFYIGPDLDLSGINVKNHYLKTAFSIFNIFKCPAPAIEINSKGDVIFHLFR
ncbi:MAG: DUF2279 domain-containing protein [Saprospiraceae bacterium]